MINIKVELLRLHILLHTPFIGSLFFTLPIKENNNIHDIEIKNYIFYFNSYYINNDNFEDMLININCKIIQFFLNVIIMILYILLLLAHTDFITNGFIMKN